MDSGTVSALTGTVSAIGLLKSSGWDRGMNILQKRLFAALFGGVMGFGSLMFYKIAQEVYNDWKMRRFSQQDQEVIRCTATAAGFALITSLLYPSSLIRK